MPENTEVVLDMDVKSILEEVAVLPDPRSHINRLHLLSDLVVICIVAVIAGAEGPKAIGRWAKSNADWLRNRLQLPNGAPAHDTIGRVLMALKPAAFQACFENWIRRLAANRKDGERQIIAIDVKGSIVTIDAAGCQKTIAAKIIEGGGDYVLTLKGNQEALHDAVVECFDAHVENDFSSPGLRTHTETVKGHGRTDEITYCQMSVPADLPGQQHWKGMRTIGVAIRTSTQADRTTHDVRYSISSLRVGIKQFAASVRGHWGIENTLHWCLDVTFREDESRVRNRLLADNIAWLTRFAISLLKQVNDKESIAMRRRMAGWNPAYLFTVLQIPA